MELPVEKSEISFILSKFQVEQKELTSFLDSSRGDSDIRWNFLFENNYVLKINTPAGMWEERLQEISRLISRYRSIGVYCPAYIPTAEGCLSFAWEKNGKIHICFIEEFAKYPAFGWEMKYDRKEALEHLGLLAARYSNTDLSDIHSMWSIIDLAPFDTDVDEKQENVNDLEAALRKTGYVELADRVKTQNRRLREMIIPEFRALPRCVFQGDLNSTNLLHDKGKFIGLIDFNCSGTDVNINVFINETNWFPEKEDMDAMSIPDILAKMDNEHAENSSLIYRHYILNDLEKSLYPYFKQLVDLFQYPNVCQMIKWLKNENYREKCARLIDALLTKPI